MAIYATEASIFLALICIPAVISLYFFFKKGNTKLALFFLVLTGFLLSFFMAAVDPYLHPWDERFHALVAKNMMEFPFRPMLLVDLVYPYSPKDWSGTHIWLHKQPLFLWQMALSMKIFGVHEITMRLPSVIMTVLSILLVFDITKHWIRNEKAAYFAAFLFTFSNYQLELLSGRYSLDQNDIAFAFYMTASIWAFVRYTNTTKPLKWLVLIGVFAGAAILNKWLTGLLTFGGWGLYILLEKDWRLNVKRWMHLIGGAVVCFLVFMPWQIYISTVFPIESAIVYAHNTLHIHEVVEGHHGNNWFHLERMLRIYGIPVLVAILFGFYFLYKNFNVKKHLSFALLAMVLVIYLFFSLIVATKMPTFAYPVNAIFWAIGGLGFLGAMEKWLPKEKQAIIAPIILFLVAITTLKPWHIVEHRSYSNTERVVKIHNTDIFKSLDLANDFPNRVVVNCKTYEDIELMFYQEATAYHWFPEKDRLDSLTNVGVQFAAFQSFGNQYLPEFILEDEDVEIIKVDLK